MSTNESGPGESPQEASYGGAIVLFGIVALALTWTYLLFGGAGLGLLGKGAATIVIFPTMFFAWRWRRRRILKQLEVLQRWADADDAKTKKRPRKNPV
ncbi:MAG TPA: hypothetical protein VFI31_00290 [Pirellulales bacterium]|nr:hypothetical protein [Pirellulales bacterium]